MSDTSTEILHRRVRNDRKEVERAFPPLELIDGWETYYGTIEAIQSGVPEYFWTAPAASSYDYHNPYACGERGLWIHTLMVSTAYEHLVDSWVEQGLIHQHEAELGRAACLLHDLLKHGDSYDEGDTAAKDHDTRMSNLIRERTDLDDRVADAVASHMGPWYDGPEPDTPLQQLVHQADMLASTKNATVGIYKKPHLIGKLYPGLPGADLQ